MGNKIVTIVTSFITLMVFVLLVAFISTDSQIDESQQKIQEFTETVQYKGCITYDQYMDLINSIPFNNIKVQITHIVNNDVDTYDPGVYDARFTSQILTGKGAGPVIGDNANRAGFLLGVDRDGNETNTGYLLNTASGNDNDKGIYKMNVGDQIKVDLVVMDGTFFNALVSTLTGSTNSSMKIVASSSGVILNTRYE